MTEATTPPTTETRKVDHIKINLEQNVQFPNLKTGLEKYRFMHDALPEVSLNEVDTSIKLFGKALSSPILISSMTGGADLAHKINFNLAEAAHVHKIAMGLGSQRAAIEDDTLASTYQIRKVAPDILLFANLGAIQLNYKYGFEQCLRAIDMVEADALILHFNVLQEAVQPEGDTHWRGLLDKVADVVAKLPVPVIAKEVGWGFSERTVRQLVETGISSIDVAGSGGTSWSEVEYHRAPTSFHANVAAAFSDWGIPTADAIGYAVNGAPDLPIIASGGLRNGIDIAKSIALGASIGGLAGPFLKAAMQSPESVSELIRVLTKQMQIVMQCTGTQSIEQLKQTPLYPTS